MDVILPMYMEDLRYYFHQFLTNLLTILLRLLFCSDTLQVLMPFCPTLSELRFYGCCHPCFLFIGVVETELGRHITDVYGRFALLFLAYFVGPFTKVRFF